MYPNIFETVRKEFRQKRNLRLYRFLVHRHTHTHVRTRRHEHAVYEIALIYILMLLRRHQRKYIQKYMHSTRNIHRKKYAEATNTILDVDCAVEPHAAVSRFIMTVRDPNALAFVASRACSLVCLRSRRSQWATLFLLSRSAGHVARVHSALCVCVRVRACSFFIPCIF